MSLDKIAHFLAGAVISAALFPWGYVPATVATVFVAIAKEVLDRYTNGTPDKMDAIATIIGGITVLAWYAYVVPVLM